jgi:hypothetical protein
MYDGEGGHDISGGTVCFSKFPFSYNTKKWQSYLCLSNNQVTQYTKFTKQAMHELQLLLYFLSHPHVIHKKILMDTIFNEREFFFSFSFLLTALHFKKCPFSFLAFLFLFDGKFECLQPFCLSSIMG